MTTSWKPEVQVSGDKQWYDNQFRFATKDEALKYAVDLAMRWTSVDEYRVTEVDEAPTYRWVGHKAVAIEGVQ